MTDQHLIDFGIWRRMDEEITAEEAKKEALEASQGAIAELKEEGVEIEWMRTDVLEDPDGETDCAYCHYRAPSEEAIREHSERAGLPVTELTRMDDQLDRDVLE
ncbi:DUF4242 domain-containing protein [Halobacteriales archaeon QH_2_65_14]|nr:MAG: DUF4242 domain-containing protein [Halobacteriales archaeon QH_2_65_14]